jgi:hypothetical protein
MIAQLKPPAGVDVDALARQIGAKSGGGKRDERKEEEAKAGAGHGVG